LPSADLKCVVEIPKGSRNKYEYDHECGGIKLDRFLSSSVVYPTDYGFVPETLALDGDPLDALICVSEPTFPGCIVFTRPIAVLEMEDEHGVDPHILCVPCHDPYKDLDPDRHSIVKGWSDRDAALQEIDHSRRRFIAGRGASQ
jgi:inorganic pyrophosphatase